MTGPLLSIVAVFCPKCGRAQIHRVEDAPSAPTPCWWCRHGIRLPKTARCLDSPAKILPTVDQ